MREKLFENKIKKYIEAKGGWQVKFFANKYTKSGIPDILACINGYFVGIEVKSDKGSPSELQLHNVRAIRRAGGFAFVLYPSGWERFTDFVDDLIHDTWSLDMDTELR